LPVISKRDRERGRRSLGFHIECSYHRPRLLWVDTLKRMDSVTARMPVRSPRWEFPCLHSQGGEMKWEGSSSVRGSRIKSNQHEEDETRHGLTVVQAPELELASPRSFSAQR